MYYIHLITSWTKKRAISTNFYYRGYEKLEVYEIKNIRRARVSQVLKRVKEVAEGVARGGW